MAIQENSLLPSPTSPIKLEPSQNDAISPYPSHNSEEVAAGSAQVTTAAPSVVHNDHLSKLPLYNGRAQRKRPRDVTLTTEEEHLSFQALNMVMASLTADQKATLFPDVDSPFSGTEDVVKRLLPYHIFQIPKEDMGKGKAKATEEDLIREELAETRFALACHKRKRALEDRFRRVRISSGKRIAPDDQAYYLAQVVLEGDRAETQALTAEVRTARAELERLEREKKVAAMPPRPTYYPPNLVPAQPSTPSYGHYRSYYPYPLQGTPTSSSPSTQAYSYSIPLTPASSRFSTAGPLTTPSTPAQNTAPSTPVAPSATLSSNSTQTPHPSMSAGSIPVQLPISSLQALNALGIYPVPPSTAPQTPQSFAVLRGTSANGTSLSLEINVSLLQPSQMSGLAELLTALTRSSTGTGGNTGNGANSASVPPAQPYAQIGAPYIYPGANGRSNGSTALNGSKTGG
ncbi:hypothetical protein OF83DRAFT_1129006 [Amylostereum chailletii]|nr:hypothetical protein OF83DRAFT_1129006 [Amylostereum chailletii]